jgi:LDH2 family malate/lactate/ureidoglycolate dehydrogenase
MQLWRFVVSDVLRYRKEDLREYVVRYMEKFGVPADDARIVGDVMIEADTRGVGSHGMIRLGSYYGVRLKNGWMDPRTPVKVVNETGTTALLDGGNGCGQVAGHRGMQLAIRKAKEANVGMVTVRRSNHYGIAAYYAMLALPHGMIGVSMTNSQPLVAPTYGRSAVLGTNPISVAVPSGQAWPYVLDMATSTVPIGKIKVYEKKGLKLPLGWGLDDDGVVTDDPKKVQSGGPGALMPLGGTDIMSGYKGYGLALLVDIFCGVLSGGANLTDIGFPHEPREANVSHFFLAAKVDAFRPLADFGAQMDHLVQMLKAAPKAKDQERIYIAGEKEYEQAAKNRELGVPLIRPVVEDLQKDGAAVGVPFDVKNIS